MVTVTQSSKFIFDEGGETDEEIDTLSKMSFSKQIGSFKFSPKAKIRHHKFINKLENDQKIKTLKKNNINNTNNQNAHGVQ